jgi:hypothetical protein
MEFVFPKNRPNKALTIIWRSKTHVERFMDYLDIEARINIYKELGLLHKKGILTDKEFISEKNKLLGGI